MKPELMTVVETASFATDAKACMEHKDPFDRLIIWPAISHKLTLISRDSAVAACRKLGLKVLWQCVRRRRTDIIRGRTCRR